MEGEMEKIKEGTEKGKGEVGEGNMERGWVMMGSGEGRTGRGGKREEGEGRGWRRKAGGKEEGKGRGEGRTGNGKGIRNWKGGREERYT